MSQPKELNAYDEWLKTLDTDVMKLIKYYESLPQVISTTIPGGSAAITYGAMQINDSELIPVFAKGDIFYKDTKGSRDHIFPLTVDHQMKLMGQLSDDDRGHLLARSLGGSNEPLNVIPMSCNLNRHLAYVPENKEVKIPRSYWRANEDNIKKFLQDNKSGKVTWRLVLRYEDEAITDPGKYSTFRPEVLTMQYNSYSDKNDDKSLVHRSPNISYYNSNDFACGYEAYNDEVFSKDDSVLVVADAVIATHRSDSSDSDD